MSADLIGGNLTITIRRGFIAVRTFSYGTVRTRPRQVITIADPEDLLLPLTINVLIQDPHTLVRDCLRMVISTLGGAEVVAEAVTPKDALAKSLKLKPDLVLIDLADPTAIRTIEAIAMDLPDSKVICLADAPTDQQVRDAISAGASGLALKSDSVEELVSAMKDVRQGHAVIARSATGPILQHYVEILRQKRERDGAIIATLASAVEAKDRYTGGHAQRVARIATKIAENIDPALGHNESLRYGFVLHDIGKIGVPEGILQKPGQLTLEEWAIMRTHPIVGLQIILPLGFGDDTEQVVRNHHERFDGTGYPDKLGEEDIPFGARIFSIADTYDAITTDRPYRLGLPHRVAVDEIRSMSGTQFDPAVVEAFMDFAEDKLPSDPALT